MKRLSLIISTLIFSLFIFGCQQTVENPKTYPSELIGTWKLVSENVADQTNLVLEKDGTLYANNKLIKGTWFVKNQKLNLSPDQVKNPITGEYISGQPTVAKYTYYLGNNNNALTLIDNDNNSTVYKRLTDLEIDLDPIPDTSNIPGDWEYSYGNSSFFQGYGVSIAGDKTFSMEKLRGSTASGQKGTWSTKLKTITFTITHKQNSDKQWIELNQDEVITRSYKFKSEKNLLILLTSKDESLDTILSPKDDSSFRNPISKDFEGNWININAAIITYYEFQADGTIFSHSQLIDQYLIGTWDFTDDKLSIVFDKTSDSKDSDYDELPRSLELNYECQISNSKLKLIDDNNTETILIKQ